MNKRVLVFGCLVLLSTVLLAGTATAQAGRSYEVTVTPEGGGDKFLDCFTFNADGSLDVALLLDPLAWARLKLDKKKNSFQAGSLTDNADGFNLAFSGKATNKNLKADGINTDAGQTFSLKGKKIATCDGFVGRVANPYQPPRQ